MKKRIKFLNIYEREILCTDRDSVKWRTISALRDMFEKWVMEDKQALKIIHMAISSEVTDDF